jgi:hypothetical protein
VYLRADRDELTARIDHARHAPARIRSTVRRGVPSGGRKYVT